MKKILLTTLVAISCLGVANARVIALGSASLKDNRNGTFTLNCPGTGFCYDSMRDNVKDIQSGDHIWVHMEGKRVEYVIVSATLNLNELVVTPVE